MAKKKDAGGENEIVIPVELHVQGCDCEKSDDAVIIEVPEEVAAGSSMQAGYSRAYARNFNSIFGRSEN